ncbi:MAG: YciI family protein [Nocardioides sp.]|uniref:YciI family protein n=1 Tax=Nocardioides sp. TaxID=35761 RepID=UPI003D6C351A
MGKYLLSIFGTEAELDAEFYGLSSAEELQQSDKDVGALTEKLTKNGWFVYADGLGHPRTATVIDALGESPVHTDGPYAESKEHLAGFWIIDVPDRETALRVAEEASWACRGKLELRPIDAETGA